MSINEKNGAVENSNSGLEKFHYKQELNRVMKLPSVVFFGVAYMAPITIFSTYGLVCNMTHGMLALTYTVATLAMMFTAMSYRHMVKAYPIAGSVYAYTQRSLNPHVGFMAGWGILLDYILLPYVQLCHTESLYEHTDPADPYDSLDRYIHRHRDYNESGRHEFH